MAKYFIQDETLTNLADKIRVLNGTEESMTPTQMNENLSDANNEVDIQSGLINQLSELLDGKAISGSSGEVETCIGSIFRQGILWDPVEIYYVDKNLTLQCVIMDDGSDKVIEVVKNSIIYSRQGFVALDGAYENISFFDGEIYTTNNVAYVIGDFKIVVSN